MSKEQAIDEAVQHWTVFEAVDALLRMSSRFFAQTVKLERECAGNVKTESLEDFIREAQGIAAGVRGLVPEVLRRAREGKEMPTEDEVEAIDSAACLVNKSR